MQDESKQIGKIFDGKTLRALFVFARPYIGFFYLLIFLTILLTVLSTTRPFLIQYTIDHYVLKGNLDGLLTMMGILVGLIVFQAITEYSNSYLSDWLGQTIIKDIRVKLFKHLMTFRLKFYDNTPIGRLITRNISDVESLADVFSEGIAAMTGDLLQILAILGIMLYLDWKLTLVSLASFPFLLLATYIFKESIKVSFNDVRLAVAKLNTFVQEHITGMSIVQIFNSEAREYKKFVRINEEHRDANLKSVLAYSIYFPVVEVISAIGTGMCIWYGSLGILEGHTTQGTLVAFILYLSMFFRPIRQIADRFNTLQMGIVSAHRILNLLDDQEPVQSSGGQTLPNLQGKVEFKNVWFSYNDGQDVLKNISFSAEPGQTIALVGATGAGKSSIINILNRFYEIRQGEVLIDGVNIKDLELTDLRKNIGLVLQDVFLFPGSIAENITLNDPTITREQLEATAELVGASEFIRKMP
ncbi:MAG: ATP-binding cassette domain-containing protein, partial [Cytophagales bacterium]|nr:ATP-binding cassette domain-containing protein [Cytophagales bacterium]